MTNWSIRVGAGAVVCLSVVGASFGASPALAQVSAANTIAPANTVVGSPKAPGPTTTVKARKTSAAPTTVAPDPASGTVDTVAVPVAEAQSFSDPLADLANAALAVLPDVGAVGVSSTVPLTPATPAAAPAVQFALTQATVPTDSNTPRPPSLAPTSQIIDTASLGDFVLGNLIQAPISKESQSILNALPTAGSERYLALLKSMAKVVGPRTKTDPAALEAVWVRTDGRRMKAILTAMAQVGTRYRYTGNKPGGFDCSGLTSYAWSQAGVKIPRTSTLQYQGLAKKASADLLPGDIVWHPGHVSMYLGANQAIVDAPQTGKTVEVKQASARSWVSFLSPL
jgi:cell wall-associated NlpC family hydrolase